MTRRRRTLLPWVLVALGAAAGCERAEEPAARALPAPETAVEAPAAAAERGNSSAPLVVFLGDSLTAGLGLAEEDAFPAVLERDLRAAGRPVRVVNAGVSGDTSAGGLARLDWLLRQRPDVLVVGLGANDGLRGLRPEATRDNLRAILSRARGAGVRVLLLGMRLPPNYGPEYTRSFAEVYAGLAAELDVPLVPFLLEEVGGRPELNLPDGIHPTAAGHRLLAATVRPYLLKLLGEPAAAR
jgi:acyl-CoA thioesterase-1